MLEKQTQKEKSWIENIIGTFENDDLYDRAMELGKLDRNKEKFEHKK